MKYALVVPAMAFAAGLSFATLPARAEVIGGQSYTPDQMEAVQTRCNELVSHNSEVDANGGSGVGDQSDDDTAGNSSSSLDLSVITLQDCKVAGLIS